MAGAEQRHPAQGTIFGLAIGFWGQAVYFDFTKF
jgi:hypothetical protein